MPISLCEWRVRIGRFVQWMREYEIIERKEKALKERTRLLKVLHERLLKKKEELEGKEDECETKTNNSSNGETDDQSGSKITNSSNPNKPLRESSRAVQSTVKESNTPAESTAKNTNHKINSAFILLYFLSFLLLFFFCFLFSLEDFLNLLENCGPLLKWSFTSFSDWICLIGIMSCVSTCIIFIFVKNMKESKGNWLEILQKKTPVGSIVKESRNPTKVKSKPSSSTTKDHENSARSNVRGTQTLTELAFKVNNGYSKSTQKEKNTAKRSTIKDKKATTKSTDNGNNTKSQSTIPNPPTFKEDNTPKKFTTKMNTSSKKPTIKQNNTLKNKIREGNTIKKSAMIENIINRNPTAPNSNIDESSTPKKYTTKKSNARKKSTIKNNDAPTDGKQNACATTSTTKKNNNKSSFKNTDATNKPTIKVDSTSKESTIKDNGTPTQSTMKDKGTPPQSTIKDNGTPTQSTIKDNGTPTQSTIKDKGTPTQSTIKDDGTPTQSTNKDNNSSTKSTIKDNGIPAHSTTKDNDTSTLSSTKHNDISIHSSSVKDNGIPTQSAIKHNRTPTISTKKDYITPALATIKDNGTPTQSTIKDTSTPTQSTVKDSNTHAQSIIKDYSTHSKEINVTTGAFVTEKAGENYIKNGNWAKRLLIQAGDVEMNPGPLERSVGRLQERELLSLAHNVSPEYYYDLCIALGFSQAQSKSILSKNLLEVPASVFEILCEWKMKQIDGSHCRRDLVDILRREDLNELANIILEGTYYSQESIPTGDGTQPLTREQVDRCGEDFKNFYRTRLCKIKTDPLDFNTVLEFERIYTNLVLLRNEMGTTRKTPLDYKDLLTTKINGKLLKRLMVEGDGGAGKTTFCSKIAWDWTNGAEQFKEFDWVLVIPLREIEMDQTIGEIAMTYLSDGNPVQPCQIDEYILVNPSKVFIIFDGLDEYDGDLVRQGTDIAKIVRSEKYTECMVLVTTRPWKAHQIKLNFTFVTAYAFIAVTGFDKEHISIYINKYFSDEPQKGQDLIRLIESNDVIQENMAPFPIYIAMLCVLWRDSDSKKREFIRRLKTFSKLFQEIITFLRDHYVSKQCADLNKDESVTQTYKKLGIYFTQIGKIALSGVMDKKLVFWKNDFSECKVAMETCCSVGVLSQENQVIRRRDRPANLTHPLTSSVFFPHKLFQEYIAGVYLADLFESNHESYKVVIDDLFRRGIDMLEEFRYLLYFTASQTKNVGFDIINRLKDKTREYTGYTSILVDVTFEVYDEDAAKAVGHQIFAQQKSLEIHDHMPAHTVSGFLFIMEIKAMKTLVLSRSTCGPMVSRDLADIICSSTSLTSLVISGTRFHGDFYGILEGEIKESKLERLSIERMNTPDEVQSCHLAKFVNNLPGLKDLKLLANSFHKRFYTELASGTGCVAIQKLTLEGLNLKSNNPSASRDLATFLCLQPFLTDLNISSHCDEDSDGVPVWLHDEFYHELARLASSSKIQKLTLEGLNLRRNDRSASRDLATFVCLQPCLTDLKISCRFDEFGGRVMPVWLHDEFYHEIVRLASSKGEESSNCVCKLQIDHRFCNGILQHGLTVEKLFPNLEELLLATLQSLSPNIIGSLAHSSLKKLSLAKKDIDGHIENRVQDDEYVEYHPSLLGDPPSLAQVFLKAFPGLTDLTFKDLVIGNSRCETILLSLHQHQHLKNICVIHGFTDEEIDPIASAINVEKRMNVKLQHDEEQKYLRCYQMSSGLADALCHRTSVKELVLTETQLDNAWFAIMNGRTVDSKIQRLTLENLDLKWSDPSASRDLARFLCLQPCLTDLKFSFSDVYGRDSPACLHDEFYHELTRLAPMSKIQMLTLERLNLESNDSSSSRDLASFLCLHPCLTDLKIGPYKEYGNVSPVWLQDGFYHEIARLASSSKIQKLTLGGLNLKSNDPRALRDLAAFLCLQPCLTDLNISFSDVYGRDSPACLHDDFYHEIGRLASSSKIQKLTLHGLNLDRNDPSASRDLATFLCLQPCLTDLSSGSYYLYGRRFMPGWLHDEFYGEIDRLASSSKNPFFKNNVTWKTWYNEHRKGFDPQNALQQSQTTNSAADSPTESSESESESESSESESESLESLLQEHSSQQCHALPATFVQSHQFQLQKQHDAQQRQYRSRLSDMDTLSGTPQRVTSPPQGSVNVSLYRKQTPQEVAQTVSHPSYQGFASFPPEARIQSEPLAQSYPLQQSVSQLCTERKQEHQRSQAAFQSSHRSQVLLPCSSSQEFSTTQSVYQGYAHSVPRIPVHLQAPFRQSSRSPQLCPQQHIPSPHFPPRQQLQSLQGEWPHAVQNRVGERLPSFHSPLGRYYSVMSQSLEANQFLQPWSTQAPSAYNQHDQMSALQRFQQPGLPVQPDQYPGVPFQQHQLLHPGMQSYPLTPSTSYCPQQHHPSHFSQGTHQAMINPNQHRAAISSGILPSRRTNYPNLQYLQRQPRPRLFSQHPVQTPVSPIPYTSSQASGSLQQPYTEGINTHQVEMIPNQHRADISAGTFPSHAETYHYQQHQQGQPIHVSPHPVQTTALPIPYTSSQVSSGPQQPNTHLNPRHTLYHPHPRQQHPY